MHDIENFLFLHDYTHKQCFNTCKSRFHHLSKPNILTANHCEVYISQYMSDFLFIVFSNV